MQKNLKLIILDRDGVINQDSPDYIKSAEEWIPISGSLEAIAKLKKAGLKVTVATNQSGVGRGYYSEEILNEMHQKMSDLLAAQGAQIDHIFYCPHLPNEGCECRKPKPGMLTSSCELFGFDPKEALMVGDRDSDENAAKAAGIQFIRVHQTLEKKEGAAYPSLALLVCDLLD